MTFMVVCTIENFLLFAPFCSVLHTRVTHKIVTLTASARTHTFLKNNYSRTHTSVSIRQGLRISAFTCLLLYLKSPILADVFPTLVSAVIHGEVAKRDKKKIHKPGNKLIGPLLVIFVINNINIFILLLRAATL